MRGVTFPGDRTAEILNFPDPTPGPGEVVLEMKASGMCGSDLHSYRRAKRSAPLGRRPPEGAGPMIVGHEPCGVVAAVGVGVPAAEARVGDRVMVHHYWGCSVCEHCRAGWSQLCARQAPIVYGGGNGHGGHAQYMKVPSRTLVPLPDELSFEAGAAISCGTGTAYGALRRIDLAGTHTIAIFGQGPVGLSATQLAAAMGARVIALDVSAERLRRAREFGADAVIDPSKDDAVKAIRALTHGAGADRSLDASSNPEARAAAVRCVRTWGVACYVGETGNVTLEVSPDMLRRQVTLVASWTFSTIGQAECARYVVDRKIDVDHLFTHTWKLEQAVEAYRLFDQQTTGKGVFLM
jgi:threonine dehydrogenase-like Zn-dependent dehydrogenase